MVKNKWIRIIASFVLVISLSLLMYFVYNDYIAPKSPQQTGEQVPPSKLKKTISKSFKSYDFINLKSLPVISEVIKNKDLVLTYQGPKNVTFSLVDVYTNKVAKEFKSANNQITLKYNDVKDLTSRYDLLTKVNNIVTKLKTNDFALSTKNNFVLIDNGGLELSFNHVALDLKKEFKIFVNDVNFYRKSLGLKKLNVDDKISELSQIRTQDEVNAKEYNFHYSKTTGYSNLALLNAGIVNSNCAKTKNFEENKFCDFNYKGKKFTVNIHNNDFEQITRGILFAHQNIMALKESPIHNRDLMSETKTHIGGAFFANDKALTLQKQTIQMYGPRLDHTDDQAMSAYINNDFNQGIKAPKEQEKYPVKFLNAAFSFYLI